jgi:hypothetical protein
MAGGPAFVDGGGELAEMWDKGGAELPVVAAGFAGA